MEQLIELAVTGAEVLRAHINFTRHPNEGYVLAEWREEFVTWHIWRDDKGRWACENGHYFRWSNGNPPKERVLVDALADFTARVGAK